MFLEETLALPDGFNWRWETFPLGFPDGSAIKNLPDSAGDSFDPWIGVIPWRRKWQTLQYSCLGNPMDRVPWRAIVHGAAESDTA